MSRLHLFPAISALAAAAAIGLPVLPLPSAEALGGPVTPEVSEVALAGVVEASGFEAEADGSGTAPFSMIAVSWELESARAVSVQVRTRSEGRWSGWTAMDLADAFPNAGGSDVGLRGATTPLWVGPSDAYQVRASAGSQRPRDLRIDLIDPGQSPADSALGQAGSAVVSAANAVAGDGRPTIISRAEWGADETLRLAECPEGPKYTEPLKVGFVHHTASGNDYGADTAAAAIRGIYAYSVNTRGYCDIPYNFIVDKYGRIFEGRYGGVDAAVLSAATGGFNTNSFAVSALGTYSTAVPTAAMVDSIGAMVGWKLGRYGRDALGSVQLTATGGAGTTAKYTDGTTVVAPVVSGHRQVGSTECPGNTLFPFMAQIRARAAQVAAATPLKPPPGATRAFVQSLYGDFLGRTAGGSEIDYWADQVFRGLLTRQEAAGGFTASTEWTRTLVRTLYADRLGREPDPWGWDYWSRLLGANPGALAWVDAGITGSEEYFTRVGGTNPDWIDAAYEQVLGRAVDPAGRDGWLAVLAGGDRTKVAYALVQAEESLNRRVTSVYLKLLGRAPDPAGLAGWPPVVAARGDIVLAGVVAASEEYFLRAQDRFPAG